MAAEENKPAAKEKDVLANIKVKDEWKGASGKINSAHLDRPVSIEAVLANPKIYLKKYARRYVANQGKGIYPLLNMFDLSNEQIEALAKL